MHVVLALLLVLTPDGLKTQAFEQPDMETCQVWVAKNYDQLQGWFGTQMPIIMFCSDVNLDGARA